MSTNCLVTKMKGVVNNDALNKLGIVEVAIKAHSFNANVNTLIRYNKATTISCSTNFIDSSQANIGPNFDVPANEDKYVFVSTSGGIVSLPNKYNLVKLVDNGNITIEKTRISVLRGMTNLTLLACDLTGDLKDIVDCSALTSLDSKSTSISGNIKHLDECTSLTNIRLQSPDITGKISDLGHLTSITSLRITNSKLTGDLKDLALNQVKNGRTTCDGISLPYVGSNDYITFNGGYVYNQETNNLSWAPNATAGKTDVTFNGTTVTVDNLI